MTKDDIDLFLQINEPVFDVGEMQYSVCCPEEGLYATWDSKGNMFDFNSIDDLLDNWIIAGKSFRDVAQELIGQYSFPFGF